MGRTHTALVVFLLFCTSADARAQEQGAQSPPKTVFERNTQPIDIYKAGLGKFTRPISSTNREAQAFFDQGFQMMYAFAKPEAIRSFREAWKRDPNCAICYWGEAWAWGSYLNAPMSVDEAPHAYAAIQKTRTQRRRSARSSTQSRYGMSKNSMSTSASIKTKRTPRRWNASRMHIPTISMPRRCTRMHYFSSSRGAARAT